MLNIALKIHKNENIGNVFSTCGLLCLLLDSYPTIEHSYIRDACVNLLFFLSTHLYLIGVWFNEDRGINIK